MNFELILCLLTFMSGLLFSLTWLIKRIAKNSACLRLCHLPGFLRSPAEFLASLFPVFFVVLAFRSFMYEPFVIPSGSLEPTLEIGDFILVNKFDYGIRLPLSHKTIIPVAQPKRGDIMVFLYPEDRSVYFIKRVIGIPGDTISYIDKVLYVNGKECIQHIIGPSYEYDEYGNRRPVQEREEDLNGLRHRMFVRPEVVDVNIYDLTVPPNHYFVMGDNRDDSRDSRYWGFVPGNNIVGKASYIWFSWNSQASDWRDKIRLRRIVTKI